MQSRVCVTVVCPSVRPSVSLIDSSNGSQRVCCWAPHGQNIPINNGGRRAAGVPALSNKYGWTDGEGSTRTSLKWDWDKWRRKKIHNVMLCYGIPHYCCPGNGPILIVRPSDPGRAVDTVCATVTFERNAPTYLVAVSLTILRLLG